MTPHRFLQKCYFLRYSLIHYRSLQLPSWHFFGKFRRIEIYNLLFWHVCGCCRGPWTKMRVMEGLNIPLNLEEVMNIEVFLNFVKSFSIGEWEIDKNVCTELLEVHERVPGNSLSARGQVLMATNKSLINHLRYEKIASCYSKNYKLKRINSKWTYKQTKHNTELWFLRLVARLSGWLTGWLAGLLAGWLAGWL